MGADGYIAIYDYSKILEKFPEVKTDPEISRVLGGYIQEDLHNPEKQLLTVYYSTCWGVPIQGLYPDFSIEERFNHELEYFPELLPKKEQIFKIMRFVLKHCKLADWHIWT